MKHVGTSKSTIYVPRGIVWSYVAQFENLNKWWSFLQFSDESVLPESGKEYEAVVNRGKMKGRFLQKCLLKSLTLGIRSLFTFPCLIPATFSSWKTSRLGAGFGQVITATTTLGSTVLHAGYIGIQASPGHHSVNSGG
jgi:hypothetical protein